MLHPGGIENDQMGKNLSGNPLKKKVKSAILLRNEKTEEGGGKTMIEAVSCGGIVIYKWKILLLYKNQNGRYMGWVLPKGTVEEGETYRQTALREVKEESGANGEIIKYVGKTQYTFKGSEDTVSKTVHWYLMSANSFYCKPQSEEFFADAGFYKFHEAYHLLKFNDERQILKKAYYEYSEMRKNKEFLRKKFGESKS